MYGDLLLIKYSIRQSNGSRRKDNSMNEKEVSTIIGNSMELKEAPVFKARVDIVRTDIREKLAEVRVGPNNQIEIQSTSKSGLINKRLRECVNAIQQKRARRFSRMEGNGILKVLAEDIESDYWEIHRSGNLTVPIEAVYVEELDTTCQRFEVPATCPSCGLKDRHPITATILEEVEGKPFYVGGAFYLGCIQCGNQIYFEFGEFEPPHVAEPTESE